MAVANITNAIGGDYALIQKEPGRIGSTYQFEAHTLPPETSSFNFNIVQRDHTIFHIPLYAGKDRFNSYISESIDTDDILTTEYGGDYVLSGGDDLVQLYDMNSDATFQVLSGPGNDTFEALDNDDGPAPEGPSGQLFAYGGSGSDSIPGGQQGDLLVGDGFDGLYPTRANDPFPTNFTPLRGPSGDDTLFGLEGGDTIFGSLGADRLLGGLGGDIVIGDRGSAELTYKTEFGEFALIDTGGSTTPADNDEDGNDFIYAGPRGNGNNDFVRGGAGADAFMLSYQTSSDPSEGDRFWSNYGEVLAADLGDDEGKAIAEAVLKGLDEAIGAVGGFLTAGIGAVVGSLAEAFIDWLFRSKPPPPPQDDILYIDDFNPSEDIIVLPLLEDVDLTTETANVAEIQTVGGRDIERSGPAMNFIADGKTFATAFLDPEWVEAMGLVGAPESTFETVLENVFKPLQFKPDGSIEQNADGVQTFIQAVNRERPGFLYDRPAFDEDIFSADTAMKIYGAFGGKMTSNIGGDSAGSNTVAGTRYFDMLTTNDDFFDPAKADTDNVRSSGNAVLHGFGGADLLYGTQSQDSLYGGDGDDDIYTFTTQSTNAAFETDVAEAGAGDDQVFTGGSSSTESMPFEGGSGNDTLQFFYPAGLFTKEPDRALRVAVDMASGTAEEYDSADEKAGQYWFTGFETVVGGPLDDTLAGDSGGTYLVGGPGDDTMSSTKSATDARDTLEGGAGADTLSGNGTLANLSYAGSPEAVSVDIANDEASGGDADGDVISAFFLLTGSAHDDTLTAGAASSLTGLAGSDVFAFDAPKTFDSIVGITDFEAGVDKVDVRPLMVTGFDQITIGANIVGFGDPDGLRIAMDTTDLAADDFIFATKVSGTGRGSAEPDWLVGGRDGDTLYGLGERDHLYGRGGADRIVGGLDGDVLVGGRGDDALLGKRGDDALYGSAGDDLVRAARGADSVYGGRGDDRMHGGRGADAVHGRGGDDLMFGDHGNDRLVGGSGDDVLSGGNGRDTLRGSDGDDVLVGGAGDDELRGNAGFDTLFAVGDFGEDAARDFSVRDDRIVIGGATAEDVSIGEMRGAVVVTVAGAETFGTIVLAGAPDITVDDILFQ